MEEMRGQLRIDNWKHWECRVFWLEGVCWTPY